ncbi:MULTISPECIES: hypothetical protein [Idiomarina]|uniref:hypothetical protein n=1 Tax=Idiomarina TaxID=135575 RepID=UPI00129A127F|nr:MULTISPECIES: hypothetical protein [Idiomarina]MRJ41630.1 hypothetical protein [Idiomarina sp. FeN1]NCU57620.1 hypothetical protein [Idiomarina sp. FenA--70]NCU60172.1 hypothetical protein [Idiomarina sp. FenBw--71]UUN13479.1 hypothetical protein KGF88_12790 [Idiomarina loihiensis]
MSIGKSGRIVLEIDPELKRELYGKITAEGVSLKEWFIASAKEYLNGKQPEKTICTGRESDD